MTGYVQIAEPLGDRMDVHLENSNGVRFVANTDPHLKFTVGDNIKMYVDIGKAHFFEPGDSPINLSYTQFKIVIA